MKKIPTFAPAFTANPLLFQRMNAIKSTLLIVVILLLPMLSHAQAEASDFMRSVGKIYVVVAVIAIIFVLLAAYLVYLDRKLTKLENQISKNE